MIIVKVSYSIFSSFLTSDHLFSFSYLAITGTTGYTTVYVKNGFAFVCDILDLVDISDFTLNWLGSGVLVNSVQDGISRGHTVYKLSKITDGTNEVAVTGSNALKIDGTVTQSGTWNITNISGTISLPTGASTSALQLTGNTNLSSIDGKTPALGQTTMAGSSPVVIASNQTVIPVSDNSGSLTVDGTVSAVQSGTWNINNVSGTISLPTDAATETSLAKLTLSQGSSTSGQSGTLIQGAVTTSAPSYSSTQTSPLSLNTSGGLRVDGSGVIQPVSQNGTWTVQPGNTANTTPWLINSQNFLYNGSSFDQQRNNLDITLLSSASRTATVASSDQINYNGKGIILMVNVSSAGTGSITPSIQIKDSISGNYFTIWSSAIAITTQNTFAYLFALGAGSLASWTEVVQTTLSRIWRLNMIHNNANAITYSVSSVILV